MKLNFLNVCFDDPSNPHGGAFVGGQPGQGKWTQLVRQKGGMQQQQMQNPQQDKKKTAAMLALNLYSNGNQNTFNNLLQQKPGDVVKKLEENRGVFYGLGPNANIPEVKKIRNSLDKRSEGSLKWRNVAGVVGGGAFVGAVATGGIAAGIVVKNKIKADEITSALTENAEKIGDLNKTLAEKQKELTDATTNLDEATALAGNSPSADAEKILDQKQELVDSLTKETNSLEAEVDGLQDIASNKTQAFEDVNPDYVEAWQNPDVDAADLGDSVTNLGPEIVMPLGIAAGALVLVGLIAVGIYKMRKAEQEKVLKESGLEDAITAIKAEHSLARQNGMEEQFFENIKNAENDLTENGRQIQRSDQQVQPYYREFSSGSPSYHSQAEDYEQGQEYSSNAENGQAFGKLSAEELRRKSYSQSSQGRSRSDFVGK